MPLDSIRRRLATATQPLHAAVDAHAAAIDARTAAAPLVAYFARGFVPLEAALERADAGRLLPEWPDRRRAHLMDAPADAAAAVEFDGDAETWGGLYVLEGSRLGATLLRRGNPVLAAHPFFREEAPFWQTFLARLDAADRALADPDGMVQGARKAFAAFL